MAELTNDQLIYVIGVILAGVTGLITGLVLGYLFGTVEAESNVLLEQWRKDFESGKHKRLPEWYIRWKIKNSKK